MDLGLSYDNRELELSEISEGELFTPKTNYINTEIGSPVSDGFNLEFRTIESLKELSIYIQDASEISENFIR